jgi:hypothetical protein
VLAARTGREQGSGGVCGGFVGDLMADFHFGTPIECAIAKYLGVPLPPVFSVRIGEMTEKKRDGGKGVRKIRGKAVDSGE